MKPACDCVECRIRTACGFDAQIPLDLRPVIMALGNVFSEVLAHVSSRDAKRLAAELLATRREWLKHPRVRVQHTEGRA